MAQDSTVEQEVLTETAQAEAQATADELPPDSGYARNEALRKRADDLARQAQECLAEIERADPSKLTVEREVRDAINEYNEVYVSNADPNYRYAWVFRDPHGEFGGRAVRRMQALGWEIVKGDMKEAIEHSHIEGRVVADCLLMRCRLDHWMVLQKRDRLLRQAQQAGVYANLFDIADKASSQLGQQVNVWDIENMPGDVKSAVTGAADIKTRSRAQAIGRFHAMNRTGGMDRMLRGGTIPGVPVGRVAAPGRVR